MGPVEQIFAHSIIVGSFKKLQHDFNSCGIFHLRHKLD